MRRRQFRVSVRLNEKDLKRLTEKVKKSGLSREAYLREMTARNTPRKMAYIDFQWFLQEFEAISVNMKRIAACANVTGIMYVDEYENNWNRLKKLLTELLALANAPAEQTNESEEPIK